VRGAKSEGHDELEQLPGSGRLPKEPCCHRRKFLSELGSVKKERAAASVFQTRASHRPSCSRHVRKERRPSTEIRLGVNFALQTQGPSLAFFVPRSRFASGRDPPDAHGIPGYKPYSRLTRGAFSDKGFRVRPDPADGGGGQKVGGGYGWAGGGAGVPHGVVVVAASPPGCGQALP